MKLSKGTFKDIALYSVANYLHTAINAVSNIFVSNILGPVNNGAISYYNAINTNIDQVVFGTFRSSIERDVPQIEGTEAKRIYTQQAFLLNLYSSFFFTFFFFAFGLFSNEPIMKLSGFMMAGFTLVRCTSDFYRIWNKALNKISTVSWIMIITSCLIPIFAILFSYWFGLYGFWSGRIILQIITFVCFIVISKEIFKFCKLDWVVLRKILISGGEIVAFSLFVTSIQTMDKYFVKSAMGLEQLGYYAIGSMIFTMLMLIPFSITGAVYPRFVGMVKDNLEGKIKVYSIYIELLCIIIAFLAFFALPYFFKWFMPAYGNSVPIAKILLVAFVSYSSVQLRYIDIIRKKNMKALISRSAFAFFMGLVLFFAILKFAPTTENFAWGTTICFVFLSLGVNWAWASTYGHNKKDTCLLLFLSVIPIIVLLPLFGKHDSILMPIIVSSLVFIIYLIRIRWIKI